MAGSIRGGSGEPIWRETFARDDDVKDDTGESERLAEPAAPLRR